MAICMHSSDIPFRQQLDHPLPQLSCSDVWRTLCWCSCRRVGKPCRALIGLCRCLRADECTHA